MSQPMGHILAKAAPVPCIACEALAYPTDWTPLWEGHVTEYVCCSQHVFYVTVPVGSTPIPKLV